MKQLSFIKKTQTDLKPNDLLEEGNFDQLLFKVYKRGTGSIIHMYNKDQSLNFKKDCQLFEEQLKKFNVEDMKDGETFTVKGSGDNDNLIFTCTGNDVSIKIEKQQYPTITKLLNALKTKKKQA